MATRRFASLVSLAVVAGSFLVAAPAHATTLDASNATFDFSNPLEENVGEDASIGDEFFYPNVVTIGGIVVDATVTITNMSDTLGPSNLAYVNDGWLEYINQAKIDNSLADQTPITAGCYSNDSVQDYEWTSADASPNVVGLLDEQSSDYDNSWINSEIYVCGNEDYPATGWFQYSVAFSSDGEPVTLTNLTVTAYDIDGPQWFLAGYPKPSSYTLGDDTIVDVEDATNYLNFYQPDAIWSDDDVDPASKFAVDITYDSVSTVNFEFGVEDDFYSQHLSLAFSSFFNPPSGDLAGTGTDSTPSIALGGATLVAGAALVAVRRVRRNRA
ncbi:MAG: hypothetical protein RLZ72_994 [Actinomycetota bacterium]|jgi:LPXTG-motif cell wall-anchored protein